MSVSEYPSLPILPTTIIIVRYTIIPNISGMNNTYTRYQPVYNYKAHERNHWKSPQAYLKEIYRDHSYPTMILITSPYCDVLLGRDGSFIYVYFFSLSISHSFAHSLVGSEGITRYDIMKLFFFFFLFKFPSSLYSFICESQRTNGGKKMIERKLEGGVYIRVIMRKAMLVLRW